MTVVETAEFLRKVKPLLSESERTGFVHRRQSGGRGDHSGDRGIRKIRWALPGMGKRGGARVIYYYHSERLPIFLLSAYAKGRKANLSKAEQNAMKRLVPALVAGYAKKA